MKHIKLFENINKKLIYSIMKHIKLFENINDIPNKENINQDILDSFVELEDFSFKITFKNKKNNEILISLYKNNEDKFFSLNDIEDRLLWIIDYMKLEWGNIDIFYYYEGVENDLFVTTATQRTDNLSNIHKNFMFDSFLISITKTNKNFIHRNFDKFLSKFK